MTPMQTLMIEQSELREAVNGILGKPEDKRTDEERAKLTSSTERLKAMEPDMRAAIVADETEQTRLRGEFAGDTEGAELRQLIAGSSIGGVFAAAIEHRSTDGRTAELQAHYKPERQSNPAVALAATRRGTRRDTGTGQRRHQSGRNHAGCVPTIRRRISRH